MKQITKYIKRILLDGLTKCIKVWSSHHLILSSYQEILILLLMPSLLPHWIVSLPHWADQLLVPWTYLVWDEGKWSLVWFIFLQLWWSHTNTFLWACLNNPLLEFTKSPFPPKSLSDPCSFWICAHTSSSIGSLSDLISLIRSLQVGLRVIRMAKTLYCWRLSL